MHKDKRMPHMVHPPYPSGNMGQVFAMTGFCDAAPTGKDRLFTLVFWIFAEGTWGGATGGATGAATSRAEDEEEEGGGGGIPRG